MLTASQPKKRRRRERHADTPVFIYALVCPREQVVRYVGQSVSPLQRFISHIQDPCNDGLSRWIRGLLRHQQVPEMICLEVCTAADAGEREKLWIKHYARRPNSRSLNIREVFDSIRTQLNLRVTYEQLVRWQAAADDAGLSLSEWVRRVLDAAAARK